jgi:hypothetical protein
LLTERGGKRINRVSIRGGGRPDASAEQEICGRGHVGACYHSCSLLIGTTGEPETYNSEDTLSLPDGKLVFLHGLTVRGEQQVGCVEIDFQFFLALWRRAGEKAP